MINTLYRTGYIGKVELKNRLVMGPAGFGFCDEDKGAVNDRMIEFFHQRARGGVGLIDVGAVQIDADHYTDHDMVKLYSDEFIDGFKRLADAVHAEGAKIMGQLLHQGRYCASREYFGEIGIGPSAVYTSYTKETPRELTTEECEELIEEFGMGAERLVKAGFDIVEICTNSGYLIGQFLSPLTNLRSDRFGGSSVEERFTFLREVILRVRRGVGPDMPISVRIGGNDFVRGSNTNEDACRIAALIEQTGGDCINVTGGWHETFLPQVTMDVPFGAYSYLGKQIKESVSIPVIQSNRMCIEQAEKLMYEDTVDFISMVRPLVADPYLMNKAAAGRYSEIRPCVGCNQGCLDHIMRHKPITCLVNAEVGREAEVMRGGKLPVESASTAPERILVVGAGPAGMEFARIAASRGHGVTIWEEKDHLGGQFDLNSVPPGRHDFARFRNYLAAEMARLGVTVVTGKKADAGEIEALVSDGSFDRVVIATGAKPICPPIPVEEGCSVVQAWDVLLKKAELGKNVVIVGGGAVGVETAEYIAEMGTLDPQVLRFLMLYKAEAPETLYKQLVAGTKKVTVIEMQPKIGRDIGITTRWGMLQRLKMYGVTTLAGTKVLSVEKAGVRVQQGDGTQAVIPADTVVLAVGSRSENALYGALEGRVRKLTLIGDAEKPAFILDAVRAAYDAAIEI